MTEPLTLILVILLCINTTLMAIALLHVRAELRRFVRSVTPLMPQCDRTLREAHRTLSAIHRLVLQAQAAANQAESVVHTVYEATHGLTERFQQITQRAHAFLTERLGNGARAEPRRHPRRHR